MAREGGVRIAENAVAGRQIDAEIGPLRGRYLRDPRSIGAPTAALEPDCVDPQFAPWMPLTSSPLRADVRRPLPR